MTVDEANRILAGAECLANWDEVTAAIDRIAAEMTGELARSRPVMLCVMNGGMIFAGQLLPRLPFPLEVGYVHAARYSRETTGGELNWVSAPSLPLRGRTVVLLDDILDEGVTLDAVAAHCRQQGAAEVLLAVLVEKEHDRKVSPGFKARYTGLATDDRFLFGCGLDYRGYWRNAPGIYAVQQVVEQPECFNSLLNAPVRNT